jgi:hypothetical protein
MVAAAPHAAPAAGLRSRWIWGPRTDIAVFGGSAALALGLVALSRLLSDDGALPPWGWLLFVVLIDVAHVHTTLFRTYLDREELKRRRALYIAIPAACFAAGVALHLVSHLLFWRVLAYLAVLHFIRQQVGWVAIYRARAGERAKLDKWLDDAVIYFATGWPLLYWHAHLPRAFRWFVEGDFIEAPWLSRAVLPLGVVYLGLLAAYVVRSVALFRQSGGPVNVGKHIVVGTTAATWFIGIVATNSDFEFTVANVIVHGVPYMALLWAYTRERAREAPGTIGSRIAAGGVLAFLGVVLVLAFVEEVLWDRLVWHDRPLLFGGDRAEPLLGPLARALVVPLLALPQATHYALDAVLWRRRDTGPAQARALGFGGAPRAGRRDA